MEAIIFSKKNEVTLDDKPIIRPSGSQVLVKVRASGICHTDIEILKGNYGSSAFPLVPGHEYVGEVAEVGSEVAKFQVGDRVVVDPNIECKKCRACKNGHAHLCESLGAYGVTTDGGFAEFSLVEERFVHSIGDLPFSTAALAEPMGCVLNGVDQIGAGSSKEGIVFGAGPIGLLFAIAARSKGAQNITFIDLNEERLELAKSMGFGAVYSDSTRLEAMRQSFDLVVDATGVVQVASQLTSYAYSGGKALFLGVCPQDARIEISPFELFRRQLTIAGSHSLNHHNIVEALTSIEQYKDELPKLVTHKLSLNEIAEIMRSGPPKGSLKIQAVW